MRWVSRGDWPRCCIMAMILDVDEESVKLGDGTKMERPPRRARKMFLD
jgi:hypothetical protein